MHGWMQNMESEVAMPLSELLYMRHENILGWNARLDMRFIRCVRTDT